MWEFKHGNGSFKRGDLVGLRDIKRRASRHALIHRDSFSGPKSTVVSAPGTPDERPGDSIDGRFISIEQSLYEINSRLARSEDHNAMLGIRLQTAIEGLTRCHQVSPELLRVASFPFFLSSDSFTFPWFSFVFAFSPFDFFAGCGGRSYVYSGQLIFRNL